MRWITKFFDGLDHIVAIPYRKILHLICNLTGQSNLVIARIAQLIAAGWVGYVFGNTIILTPSDILLDVIAGSMIFIELYMLYLIATIKDKDNQGDILSKVDLHHSDIVSARLLFVCFALICIYFGPSLSYEIWLPIAAPLYFVTESRPNGTGLFRRLYHSLQRTIIPRRTAFNPT